jgi:hypothetical protein
MPEITVSLTDEEFEDLREICQRHPQEYHSEGEALKALGLKRYRSLKRKYDPGRKKPMAILKLLENDPGLVPCAFSEELQKHDIVEADEDTFYIRADEQTSKMYDLIVESCLARGQDPPTMG